MANRQFCLLVTNALQTTYALETTLIDEVAQDFADINKLSLFFALSQKVLPRWNTLENAKKDIYCHVAFW